MSELYWQIKYSKYGDTFILELPYKVDGYAMVLLLPEDPANFAKWESEMTADKFNLARRSLATHEVFVRMPKFTVENSIALNEPLKQLGMPTAFDPKKADFSKITTSEPLYVSEALQKTFIRVNETGTEAAAVTGGGVAMGGLPSDPPKEFYADRPFLYAIVKGDAILFLGRFVKPEQGE
jgi:serpin B